MAFRSTLLSFIGATALLTTGCSDAPTAQQLTPQEQAVADSITSLITHDYLSLHNELQTPDLLLNVINDQNKIIEANRKVQARVPGVYFVSEAMLRFGQSTDLVAYYVPPVSGAKQIELKRLSYRN